MLGEHCADKSPITKFIREVVSDFLICESKAVFFSSQLDQARSSM